MSRIHMCEDPSTFIENVRPKHLQKCAKAFPAQVSKKRTVLQTLCSHQHDDKQSKKSQKENTALVTNIIPEQRTPFDHLIKFQAVFKKKIIPKRFQPITESKEYEADIWKYLCTFEKQMAQIKPYYMSKQNFINWDMRSVLVDWLVSVADEYKMDENTIHLSVNYLDRFLSNMSVISEKFQLVGATAMMLAGKVDEIYPPDAKEWSYLTGDAFDVSQILKMEQLMLKVLNFEMNAPTALDFLRQMCFHNKIDSQTTHLAMYLSELVLLEGAEYLRHLPSKLAAASLCLARHTLKKREPWPKYIEQTSGYTFKQLSPVVQKQNKTFTSSPFKEQQAIQKKYAREKYQKVGLLRPRVLLLDEEE